MGGGGGERNQQLASYTTHNLVKTAQIFPIKDRISLRRPV